jgi:hypothetical protein
MANSAPGMRNIAHVRTGDELFLHTQPPLSLGELDKAEVSDPVSTMEE